MKKFLIGFLCGLSIIMVIIGYNSFVDEQIERASHGYGFIDIPWIEFTVGGH